jgi:putative transposase
MFNLAAPPDFRGLDPHVPVTVYYRHLPHWRQQGATYYVTFHLNDALPEAKVRELKGLRREWESRHPPLRSKDHWESYARQFAVKAERWIDEGHGRCYFAEPAHAKKLADAMLSFKTSATSSSATWSCQTIVILSLSRSRGTAWKASSERGRDTSRGRSTGRSAVPGPSGNRKATTGSRGTRSNLYRVVQYIGHNPAKAGLPPDRWYRWIHPRWQQAGWNFVD